MSIATKRGDTGQTSLVGGLRVSKAELRVESYGTIDELNAHLGFARSICGHEQIKIWTEEIQKTLFRVGSALATPPESRKAASVVTAEDVDKLTDIVHLIEARPGILSDWSIPGAHPEASAYDIARTVCRRAERDIVRLAESGAAVEPEVIAYTNRLSDVLWLFGRWIELEAGVDSRLRDAEKGGPRWSRAW
ncbi:MAG TPA: cob(I)yrinic acid a,c-diamide adenosyltransferase [Acidobacteriaceae bacterium]|nr:cob(I)yrinic acid a,c-diamide adenosyltransferase [Acidobacteriaceae bacterium]